jgi:acyl carrier protein
MSSRIHPISQDSIRSWLTEWLAGELGVEAGGIDVSKSFLSYGLNSLQAMMLAGDLENALGLPLAPTLAWDYPCVADLTNHLVGLTEQSVPARTSASEPAREMEAPQVADLSDDQVDALLRNLLK